MALDYLSGLKGKIKQAVQKRKTATANKPAAKKKTIFKAKPRPAAKPKKAGVLKKAIAKNKAIIKKIAIKKPVLASKIQRAQANRALKRAKVDTETKNILQKVKAEQNRPLQQMESFEQDENFQTSSPMDESFEQPENFEASEDGTIDASDFENEGESEDVSEMDESFSGLCAKYSAGASIGGKLKDKRVAKRLEKKKNKNIVKQSKPKNVKKQTKVEGKAEKRKATGKARILKGKSGGGAKDTINKLINKGGEILEKQINKRTGGGETDSEGFDVPAKKESFFESIPMPVKIGGLALLGLGAYKAMSAKK